MRKGAVGLSVPATDRCSGMGVPRFQHIANVVQPYKPGQMNR